MAKLAILKGSTDVTVYIFVQNSSLTTGAGLTGLVYNSASLVCYYVRPLGSAAALALATQTVTGAHSDGGFVEVDATNMPGVYRLDLSDAVVASGVNSVALMLKGATNMAPVLLEVQLVSYNPNDATRLGLTALPNAAADAAGGLPISDAGGLDLDAQRADVTAILVDTGTTLDARIPAALVSGRIDASVGAMAANVLTATAINADAITAAKIADGTIDAATFAAGAITAAAIATGAIDADAIAADAVTEIQSGLATAAALATVDQNVDDILVDTGTTLQAELDGIQADTEDIQTRLPAALGANGNIKADVRDYSGTAGTFSGGRPEVNTTHAAGTAWGSGAITAGAIATGAIDADAVAPDAVTELQSGLATAANLASVAGYVDTEVAAIKAVTDKLDTALELDGAVYRYTTNALEQAPSGGGGGTDWTADEKTAIKTILGVPASGTTPDAPTAGALKVIDDFLDTEVAAIKTVTDAIGATGTGLSAIPWNPAWDAEVQSEVADAIVAYDPPTQAELVAATSPIEADTQDIQSRLPAALTGAGNIKADALVVSDKTGYALTTAPLTAAETRTAVGLASANLDTQIGAVATNASTAAAQSTAAASSAATAATQATNAAADALQAKKIVEAMPILDTSTTPWSLKLIQKATGTSGANYLDGTVLRTVFLYTAAGVAVTAATQVVGSQRDS